MLFKRFVSAAAVLTAAGLVLTGGCKEEEAQTVSLPAVVVEPAIEMEFADSVTEVGEVQAYDTVGLSANVSGFLTEVNFKEGELVKKGTKLFQIDPAVYDAAVKKAEAEVKKAQAQLTNSTVEFERHKQLLKTNATAQTDYDKAEMNLRTAQAELKYAEASLAEKKVDLAYTKILAPFDGYIGFKKYSVGNMVGPSSGALAHITAAGDVKIYFSISELTMLKILDNYPDSQTDVTAGPAVKVILQDGREYKEKVWISAWNNMVQDGTFRIQEKRSRDHHETGNRPHHRVSDSIGPDLLVRGRRKVGDIGIIRVQKYDPDTADHADQAEIRISRRGGSGIRRFRRRSPDFRRFML